MFGSRMGSAGRERANAVLVVLMAAVLSTTVLTSLADAADADLDPSFDGDGRVVSDFGVDDTGAGLAVQPDGRIVVAGTSCGGDFLAARYNPDGSPDPTFDGDGRVCIDVGAGSADVGEEILLLPGGGLVVAGTSAGNFALVRLNADGSLDPTFGTGGRATFDLGATDQLRDAALIADGSVVMVGETTGPGCPSVGPTPGQTVGVAVARTTPDGSPDAGFGTGGSLVRIDGSQVQRGLAVAVQADGAILIGGRTSSCTRVTIDSLLFRLSATGTLDAGFTAANPFPEPGPDSIADIAVQAGGKVVVAVDTFVGPATLPAADDAFTVIRHNPDGTADTTFDGDGVATALFGAGTDATPASVVLQGDAIVVGGSVDGDFALARFDASGALDTSFGGDGMVTTDVGGVDVLAALAVQADGRILAAGTTDADVAVVRYGTTGEPPSTVPPPTTTTTVEPPPTTTPPPDHGGHGPGHHRPSR